jgi:hypothetical protein
MGQRSVKLPGSRPRGAGIAQEYRPGGARLA